MESNLQNQVNKGSVENAGLFSESNLSNIVSSVPGITAIIDLHTQILVTANNFFEKSLGFLKSEINAICFADLIFESQKQQFFQQLYGSINDLGNCSKYLIYDVRVKDNTVKSFFIYISPVVVDNIKNDQLFFLLLLPNLTNFETPYWSAETRDIFLKQINYDKYGTFEWRIGNDELLCTKGVYDIFEVENGRKELFANLFQSFIHPDEKVKYISIIKNLIEKKDEISIELKIISHKDNVKILHLLCVCHCDDNGMPSLLVGSIRDITGERSKENNLKKMVEELNASNRELEEFAYVASHDLQEPLRKITTFSDRLADKYKNSLTEEGEMYIDRIIASAENMRTLINDLLEFSRISKTTQPFGQINLNSILRMIRVDLELRIEETGTALESDELPVVEAINSQMKQLFTNLISNAIKFRKQGVAPTIKIKTEAMGSREKSERGLFQSCVYHKISIQDNGIGFDEVYANRIFQVFQRLHGKSEYPGSGVGLAICKKIMDYHHGQIFASSTLGEGANFTIIIPEKQELI